MAISVFHCYKKGKVPFGCNSVCILLISAATCGDYYFYLKHGTQSYTKSEQLCNGAISILPTRKIFDYHGECLQKSYPHRYWVEKEGQQCLYADSNGVQATDCASTHYILCVRGRYGFPYVCTWAFLVR